jgi:rhodanese-related sulfurtransferase
MSKNNIPYKELGKSWIYALFLLIISTGISYVFNSIRKNGLPWVRRAPFDLLVDCPEIAENLPEIEISKIDKNSKNIFFVDSRLPVSFAKGHIKGAMFLPIYETEPIELKSINKLEKLKKGTWIVVYGNIVQKSGERLVTVLKDNGVRGVYVLKGGFEAYKKANRKIEKFTPKYIESSVIQNKLYNKEKLLFIDAREEDAFEEGNIQNSINLVCDDLLPPEEKILKTVEKHKDYKLIVYGDDGKIDEEKKIAIGYGVAAELYARGFKNIYILKGGYKAWMKFSTPKNPLENKIKQPAKEGNNE